MDIIFFLFLQSNFTIPNKLKKLNMKKIVFLSVAVFFLGVNCFAQNEAKFKSLKANIEKNDLATQHPKKGINPKTWVDRGKLFQEAYNVNVGSIYFGMIELEAKIAFKEPKNVVTSEKGGVVTETFEYSQINIHFENGMLKSWEETQKVVNNPLMEAVKAYQKATSLDEKGKNAKKINEAYQMISIDLENRFFNEYALLKVANAYQTALDKIEVSKLLGFADTTYYFYAGYMAIAQSEAGNSMWKEARQCLEKALTLGYKQEGHLKGQIYDLLYHACVNTGDSLQALKYAQAGFELNPNYEGLMINLINYYLKRGENHKTMEYLEQAVARDPQNPMLLFAQGKVFDELGEPEKSHAAYDAAIAIDPTFFDAYFNKGVLFHNTAVKLMEDAESERDMKIYNAKLDIAFEEFAKAIPFLEKAHTINPNELQTKETLSQLYFRLRTKYPELEVKYHEMNKKLGKE